jgi:hypothetical protein
MSDVVKQIVESGGLIALLAVFVALPYLYLSLATEVHKDCLEFRKVQADRVNKLTEKNDSKGLAHVSLVAQRIDSNSRVFEVEWWVLASLAIIMLGIFHLPELANLSQHMPQACRDVFVEANCVMTSVTSKNVSLRCVRSLSVCEDIKNVFILYTLAAGILIGFRLWWARIAISRDLHYLFGANEGVPDASVRL